MPHADHAVALLAAEAAGEGEGEGEGGWRRQAVALAPAAGVAAGWLALGLGLCGAMNALYFGDSTLAQCAASDAVADGWSPEAQALETALGALPILLRNTFLLWLLWNACRKLSGFEDDGAHVARAILIGRGSRLGSAPAAGWDAIATTAMREPRGMLASESCGGVASKALSSECTGTMDGPFGAAGRFCILSRTAAVCPGHAHFVLGGVAGKLAVRRRGMRYYVGLTTKRCHTANTA